MVRALWNGVVLAESDDYEIVEGNVYFPPETINRQYFAASDHQTVCSWKGVASYLNAEVNGDSFKNAAWFYPDTKSKADHIKDYVAFYSPPVHVEG